MISLVGESILLRVLVLPASGRKQALDRGDFVGEERGRGCIMPHSDFWVVELTRLTIREMKKLKESLQTSTKSRLRLKTNFTDLVVDSLIVDWNAKGL